MLVIYFQKIINLNLTFCHEIRFYEGYGLIYDEDQMTTLER